MKKSTPIILFFAAIAVRLFVHFLIGYTVDDAFITFRCAENLATGNGFVYNLGERVLGTTTPLFTLLLALANLIGIKSLSAAMLINCIASGVTAVLLYWWARKIGLEKLSILPSILYACFPRSVVCDICGMETAFFTMLVVGTLFALYTKRDLLAMTFASFVAVTRPEGLTVLAVVLIWSLVRNRDGLMPRIVPVLLILGNWLLFSYLYFGSIVPNSLIAKRALYGGSEQSALAGNVGMVFALGSPMMWIVWALFVLGALIAARNERLLMVIALWSAAYLGALAFSGTHVFFWYSAPVYPLVFLIAVVGMHWLLSSFVAARALKRSYLIASLAGLAIVISSSAHLVGQLDGLGAEMSWYNRTHIAAAEYLSKHASPNDRVLAEDIGNFGYAYRGAIIDRDGLVTPQAIPYNQAGKYREFADSVRADWLFLAVDYPTAQELITSPRFQDEYQRVAVPGSGDKPSHQLFRANR
jgi:hypothetical protein